MWRIYPLEKNYLPNGHLPDRRKEEKALPLQKSQYRENVFIQILCKSGADKITINERK